MFCKRDSKDPLAQLLFEDEGLNLLGVAFDPKELAPGRIIRSFPRDNRRRPEVFPFETLLKPVPPLQTAQYPYHRIERSKRSGKLDAKVVASLAPIASAGLSAADVEAALAASGSSEFHIALEGAVQVRLGMPAFELKLQACRLTVFGGICINDGERFFIVTETLIGSRILISSASKRDMALEALAKLQAAGQGKFKTSLAAEDSATIEMEPIEEPMVLGFKTHELVIGNDGTAKLRGQRKPLNIRDAEFTMPDEVPAVDQFTTVNSMFAVLRLGEEQPPQAPA